MSRDIHQRWHEHLSDLTRHVHNNQYLQNAWDKYGKDNFEFSIIERCEESLLSERECFYIKTYKSLSHENGYNLTPGGENTSIGKLVICLKNKIIYNSITEAAKNANVVLATMKLWCDKKHNYALLDDYNSWSDEEKEYWCNFDWVKFDHERLSKAHSADNLSESTRKKVSENTTGSNNPRAYKVYCPQLDEVFDCCKYAADKYGINRGSISSCIKGKLKSAGIHPITKEKLIWFKV